MRHVILKGISAQLVSACERVNAGLPTVMTTTSAYIAVGTSHGLVLVFDGHQALKFSLGSGGGIVTGGGGGDQGGNSIDLISGQNWGQNSCQYFVPTVYCTVTV